MKILRSKFFAECKRVIYPHSIQHSAKSTVGKTDKNGDGYLVIKDLPEELKEQLRAGLANNPTDASRNFVGPIVAASLPKGDMDDHYDNYLAKSLEYVGSISNK